MVQKELSPLISRWFCSANRKLTEKARGIRTALHPGQSQAPDHPRHREPRHDPDGQAGRRHDALHHAAGSVGEWRDCWIIPSAL